MDQQQHQPAPRKLHLAKETLQRLDRSTDYGNLSDSCQNPQASCRPNCSGTCPF